MNLTDLPGELYYDADEGLPSNTVRVECPCCHEELEVKLVIINDSDGDAEHVHYFTTIDDYNIDWTQHEECRTIIELGSQSEQAELEATIIQAGFNLIQTGNYA